MKMQPILYLLLGIAMGFSAIYSFPEKPWYDSVRTLSLSLSLLSMAFYFHSGIKLLQYIAWAFGSVFVVLLVFSLVRIATG